MSEVTCAIGREAEAEIVRRVAEDEHDARVPTAEPVESEKENGR